MTDCSRFYRRRLPIHRAMVATAPAELDPATSFSLCEVRVIIDVMICSLQSVNLLYLLYLIRSAKNTFHEKSRKTVATRAALFDSDKHNINVLLGLRPRPH